MAMPVKLDEGEKKSTAKREAIQADLLYTEEGNVFSYMSHLMGKPTMWFLTRSDTN